MRCYETNRAIDVIKRRFIQGLIWHQISTFTHAAQDRSLWPTVARLHHTQDKERYQSIRQAHRPSVVLKKKHGMRNRHGDVTGTGLAQTWYVMNEVLAPCGLTVSEKGLERQKLANMCQTPPATWSHFLSQMVLIIFFKHRLSDFIFYFYICPAAVVLLDRSIFPTCTSHNGI